MGLPYEVVRFCARALRDPQYASDPNVLQKLANWGKDAFEGIVALHAPMAPLTWEVNVLFPSAQPQSNRQPFRFPWPVEIIGMLPIVRSVGSQEATAPTINDVRVQIDTDAQNYMTSGDGVATPAGGTVGAFVSLAAISVLTPRLLGYKLRTPTPDIGFTFQWVLGPDQFKDALISVAMFARRINL
jgi:hypothetical protein